MEGHASITGIILQSLGAIADYAPEFANYVERNIDSTLNSLQSQDRELACKITGLSYAKESFKEVADAGHKYLDSIDDFFYYGKNTDFESIIRDIRDSDGKSLNQFLHKMDTWLNNIGIAYEDYIEKCDNAFRQCTECAESCAYHQAKARSNKNKARVVGGTASALAFAGGITGVAASVFAGIFTLGLGTAIGLSITAAGVGTTVGVGAAVVTGITAHEFGNAEASFRSMGSDFRELARQAFELKHQFDDIKEVVNEYERNHSFVCIFDLNEKNLFCSALESMQWILQSRQPDTAEATDTLKNLKERMTYY